ncbi:MAG TPA: ornithine--oxo-acid transaminase [Usitatibacteraceae bacterium]|nr:ornithine--oxo-acid transaminase [Usitatibacteraceae bacterium]
MGDMIALERRYAARNYDPLPVVLTEGAGAWLTDEQGRRYLDMLSAYSAVSFGHAHPRLVAVLTRQAGRLAVTSRVFHNDRLPPFLARLCQLTGMDRALPMNTGAEAVETAIKCARKWAHEVKGVPDGHAQIVVCENNFHGRTSTIVGFSSEPQYRRGFGPFGPGFRHVPFGDSRALEEAIGRDTAAFLVEPIQGEAGVVVPPAGYLAQCAAICRHHGILLLVDEVQTGLGRTGRLLACEHEGVRPDGLVLGKALGGGLLPVSAFLANDAVMGVLRPGDHGSTFGGNPLAAAVGLEALDVLVEERLSERAAALGEDFLARLRGIDSPIVREVRGRGLLVGMEIDPARSTARRVVDCLLARGLLSKDTRGTVVRFAPPLVIGREELDWAMPRIREALAEAAG